MSLLSWEQLRKLASWRAAKQTVRDTLQTYYYFLLFVTQMMLLPRGDGGAAFWYLMGEGADPQNAALHWNALPIHCLFSVPTKYFWRRQEEDALASRGCLFVCFRLLSLITVSYSQTWSRWDISSVSAVSLLCMKHRGISPPPLFFFSCVTAFPWVSSLQSKLCLWKNYLKIGGSLAPFGRCSILMFCSVLNNFVDLHMVCSDVLKQLNRFQ